jgi:hypothetical protein
MIAIAFAGNNNLSDIVTNVRCERAVGTLAFRDHRTARLRRSPQKNPGIPPTIHQFRMQDPFLFCRAAARSAGSSSFHLPLGRPGTSTRRYFFSITH